MSEANMPVSGNAKKLWDLGFLALAAAAFFRALAKTAADPDLWGHVRFGLDMLAAKSVRLSDAYSYTSGGQQWINHEWLSEVLFAAAWSIGGTAGLQVLKLGVGFLTAAVLFGFLLSQRIHPLRAVILLFISFYVLMPTAATIRPQMFTTLFLALTLIALHKAESGRWRWLWTLPVLFAVWPNLHGGFLAGGAFVGMWTLIHLFTNAKQWRRFVFPILISACACMLNPYGYRLVLFLLKTATVARPEIVEWAPLHLASLLGINYLLLLTLSILGIVYSRKERSGGRVLIFAVAALAPFFALRHVNLFAVSALVLAGVHMDDAWDRLMAGRVRELKPKRMAAMLPWGAALFLLLQAIPFFGCIEVDRKTYPLSAVSILKRCAVKGNLVTSFNWGEYVIWHLGPDVKVLMDGRRETVYPPAVYEKYLWFHFGIKEWDYFLNHFGSEIALLESEGTAANLLRSRPEWKLVFRDDVSVLFVRGDSAWLRPVQHAAQSHKPAPIKTCFP